MRRALLCFTLTVFILAVALAGTAAAATIYVDKHSISPFPDGTSWESGFKTVQEGLNAAVAGDEVWVAKATYVENITLKSGVALYGGFTGLESVRGQRDFKVNETVLDGNQAGSVVKSTNDTSTATRIDGFTIKNGSGTVPSSGWFRPNQGCGVYCYKSSLTIANNLITENRTSAYTQGGGIFCYMGSPIIVNNTIIGNGLTSSTADEDGGIGIWYYCNAIISNNTISNNNGVGIRVTNNCSPSILDNTISSNTGPGIACNSYGSVTIASNIVSNNTGAWGSGINIGDGIKATITNNTIINNTDNGFSSTNGAIYSEGYPEPSLAILNNIVAFNSSGIYATQYYGVQTLKNNNVYGNTKHNYSIVSPGPGDISVDPLFVDRANGDYHLQLTSACIDAGYDGAIQAGWVDIDGEARIMGAHVDIGADEVNPDTSTPSTTLELNGTLGQNGWYISDVVASLSATDTGTGVAKTEYSLDGINWTAYTEPFTVSEEGITTIHYRSTDNAGNVEKTNQADVKIDKSLPFIYIGTPGNGLEYKLSQLVLAQWLTNDYISGIFAESGTAAVGQPIDTTSIGQKSFTVTTKDYAGFEVTETVSYLVRYDYFGVLAPINQDGTSIYEIASGRTIPVKFELKDANGNLISTAAAKLSISKVGDDISGTEVEAISTSAATEGNQFSYDSADNQYIFNLATEKLTPGTWKLRISLDDGTSKYVNISVR